MKHIILFLITTITFWGCLSAPEYERDNFRDLSSGIPYVLDSRYQIDRNGLIVNWVDGSIQNDVFIITQKMYDQSEVNTDSLIRKTTLVEDRTFFQDLSGEYGYPYLLIITSIIYENGDKIKAQYSDTLDIEFGELVYRSQVKDVDSLNINWQTIPNPFVNEGILVEVNNGSGWKEEKLLPYLSRSFKYGLDKLELDTKFRISLVVRNFNNSLSRASGFEVEVD